MPDSVRNRLPRLPDSPGPFSGWPLVAGQDLLVAGGDLDPALVGHAYRHGVFPWYGEGDPVLWWCPDPRAVIPLAALHVPARLERTLRTTHWSLRRDSAFAQVVRACAQDRPDGTWILPEMIEAFVALHQLGQAHAYEVWSAGDLVGGLYGVEVPPVFCAESKFHRVRDASKAALVWACRDLAARGFTHMDVQFLTPHLERLGAREIPRREYLRLLSARRSRGR